jgi:hypothetical protein
LRRDSICASGRNYEESANCQNHYTVDHVWFLQRKLPFVEPRPIKSFRRFGGAVWRQPFLVPSICSSLVSKSRAIKLTGAIPVDPGAN